MFTNAHCIAPACGPVRAAMMAGITPWNCALYRNDQPLRSVMTEVTLMSRHFANNGYHTLGSGNPLSTAFGRAPWLVQEPHTNSRFQEGIDFETNYGSTPHHG